MSFGRELIERLGGWANELAVPLMPPRVVSEGDDRHRLEFRQHNPHAVMVGKLIRAVSGLHGALFLAEAGYVAECGALLRTVSDFCTEISAIGEALNRGGEPPRAVRNFANQYCTPKARTPEEYAAKERTRYVSREELMKAEVTSLYGPLARFVALVG